MRTPDALALLLECVHNEYADDQGDVEERVVAQPGQTRTEDWCQQGCGTLYVRLDSMVPSSPFPNPDRTVTSVSAPLAATWHIGVLRCIPGMDAQGNPPDALDQTTAAAQLAGDADKLLHAIRCCLTDHFKRGAQVIGAWTPTGPSGDCAGGYWVLTTRLT
jgi:hypothetical protein